jgi:hypothetical protein
VQVDGKPEFVIEVEENGHETVEFRHGVAFMKSTVEDRMFIPRSMGHD